MVRVTDPVLSQKAAPALDDVMATSPMVGRLSRAASISTSVEVPTRDTVKAPRNSKRSCTAPGDADVQVIVCTSLDRQVENVPASLSVKPSVAAPAPTREAKFVADPFGEWIVIVSVMDPPALHHALPALLEATLTVVMPLKAARADCTAVSSAVPARYDVYAPSHNRAICAFAASAEVHVTVVISRVSAYVGLSPLGHSMREQS
mmetsp:Transcript_33800/g.106770  ORF Transcript_33800/g.106770 Transcript_33800/m.106770 type:complete len:205 (+) Transcript_33800:357-971(+)